MGPLQQTGAVPLLDIDGYWALGIGWLRDRGHIDQRGARVLSKRFGAGRDLFAHYEPVLLHGDLWPPACFFAPDSNRFHGMIDFRDASIGPAAWEFSLVELEKREWPEELLDAYASQVELPGHFTQEVAFYRLVNTVRLLAWMEPWAPESYRPTVYRNVLEAVNRYVEGAA